MSNSEPRFESYVRRIENAIGRPLTAYERDRLALADEMPGGWMRTFVSRQGTEMPDFDALAERKAELDRKLLDEPPHDPRP
jgi:hypothetical protein